MYPFLRMVKELIKFRNAPAMRVGDIHISEHRCWPWDIDLWAELNNGRTLTLYDLGRIPLAQRAGLVSVMRKNGWGMTMAGVSVRYRRRIRTFEKIEMHSRAVCWDDKFLYLEQSMWKKNGECANHALYRSAITDASGIVAPERVLSAMGHSAQSPEPADWIKRWIEADAARPWPPMQDKR
ncbi:acyl-CoA thioesterase [Shimia abyssi]|uniref:Acyl-CoA thioesterase FadM n=1 Tax=Shimia abyssi TaxID=1662395 RepID=A0A2P8FBM3_9RHOB|nr:acyl-CoA thioesterase [Shimia abyssi]PSL19113.1 acyl-CoA thioesterase FadM [Shimia abyssi]